jgi:hypothetical protein
MMYQIKQSSASYPLLFLMIDSSDHITGKTGLTPTVTISKNGAGFGSPSGTVTEIASGWYKVAGHATDSATLGLIALHATSAGADPYDGIAGEVVAFDPQDAVALGLSRIDAAVTTRAPEAAGNVAAIKTQTDKLAFTVANQVDANVIDWKGAAAPAMTGDAFARLGAPAGSSVSADIAAVNTKTTNLPTSPAAVGSAMTLTAAYDAAKTAAAPGAAMTLTAAGIDAVLDEVVEGSLTMRQMLRVFMAALAGKASGGGTTAITFRDNAVTLDGS